MKKIILKKNREKPVLKHHPWIFSGAIEHIQGNPVSGDLVIVTDNKNEFLAYGFFSEKSQISVRLLEWKEDVQITDEWFFEHIKKSIEKRKSIINTNAKRLIYSEADYLPGLIVDQYNESLVIQTLIPGMDIKKEGIINFLKTLCNPQGIYERNDASAIELEGLPLVKSVVYSKK